MADCIFCSIAKHNTPHHEIIWSDANHIAFLDIQPSRNGHTLVIPNKHWPDIISLPQKEYGQLFEAARQVALLLKEKTNCDLVAIVAEGSSVAHAHIHLIPLQKGEVLATFNQQPATPEELALIAKKIKG